ncbi:MAG: 2,3-bisphosphoglycerate-independent phosphoglycerate mutase [Gaiellaceae bacterium]|nr:2,3-bisphosphoglycerate-independent phosphoglycerate mutase [Gaiellaceae bacterium]
MHPIVVLLLDGLADRAHDSLGGSSGLEAAQTPNLDRLVTSGSNGVLYAIGPGRAPSSEVAHWSMLGYRPDEFPGRAVFEALGRGQEVDPDHVFAYAALRPAERREDGWWLTGRPDPGRDAEEAERLIEACDGITIDGLTFSLTHVWRGEAILRVSGGADERVTDSDAFFRDRHPVLRPQALVGEAERTAVAAEAWSREVLRRLEGEPFNVITLRWWGRPRNVPTFEERHGLHGTFIASSAFLRGLAKAVGLAEREEPETDAAASDLRGRIELAHERLEDGDSFVFCHVKSADAAGHTKNPVKKRAMIETLDGALVDLPTRSAIVCVTGDHATPAFPEVIHSGDPVPFVVSGPGVRADRVREFGESTCADGIFGHLRGPDMMPVLLNAADRPLFLGSRPTPFDGADGYPSILDPL